MGFNQRFAFPSSTLARRWGLQVSGIDHVRIPPAISLSEEARDRLSELFETRAPNQYRLIMSESGSSQLECGRSAHSVEAGNVLVLFPGTRYRLKPEVDLGVGFCWTAVCGEFIDHMVGQKLLVSERPVIKAANEQSLRELFGRLVSAASTTSENPLPMSGIAMEILAQLCGSGCSDGDSQIPPDRPLRDPVIAEALDIIWNSPNSSLNIPELVKRLPICRRSLERRFQQTLGHSLLTEITHCRVQRAKSLLRTTDYPIKQLAQACGFANAEALNRAFRRCEGITPSRYRRCRP